MKSTTAIYWWAFNPPTLWHLHVIKQVFEKSNIKKIIIVPDWIRDDKDYSISENHRKKIINIFIKELKNEWFNVELENYFIDWKNNSNTTTYKVEKYFTQKLKNQPFHIFWVDISEWIKYWTWNPNKYIQKKLRKIFIPRKWYEFSSYDLERYKLLKIDKQSAISSTEVRVNINNIDKLSKLLMKDIHNYIKENNLYK